MKRSYLFSLLGGVLFCISSYSQDTAAYCNCYFPLDTLTYQVVPATLGIDTDSPPNYFNNTNSSPPIKLPFKFCFYGTMYDTIYIANEGNVSFVKPVFKFTKGNLPAGKDTMMIAPFWADIDNTPYGTVPPAIHRLVWYEISPTHLIVKWNTVGFYVFDDDLYDTFQLILTNGSDSILPGGNNISFCYSNMQWASADSSGGSMGFGGIPATIGINKGDGSTYAVMSKVGLPGLGYYGPTAANNGLYWLNGKSLVFNSCVTEKNIPPVIISPPICDTFQMCPYDTLTYTSTFLCSEQGQKANITASSASISGVSVDTISNPNSIYTGVVKVYASPTDVGTHIVNITATDNSTPPQTSTYPIVVIVNACTGINEVSGNADNFSIYPNCNNGKFTVELATGESAEGCEAYIYDMMGRELYSQKIIAEKTEMDLSAQPKGMYFLKLYRGNMVLGTKKIIVQ